MSQRAHVPSAKRFRAQAARRLEKLAARQGKVSAEEVNQFLRQYGRAVDLEDVLLRTLLRRAGLRLVREGTRWVVSAKG